MQYMCGDDEINCYNKLFFSESSEDETMIVKKARRAGKDNPLIQKVIVLADCQQQIQV
jgi:hypothetical protein